MLLLGRHHLDGDHGRSYAGTLMPQPRRHVRHSKRFLLTPNRARHPLGVSLRTFDQRRSLCPGAAVTGDSEKSRSRSLGDKPS
jgi:hypothetical protein